MRRVTLQGVIETEDTQMTTTYQLTADFMIQKLGAEAALAVANSYGPRDKFWQYVAACITKTVAA
jgi:hypothetical protein